MGKIANTSTLCSSTTNKKILFTSWVGWVFIDGFNGLMVILL